MSEPGPGAGDKPATGPTPATPASGDAPAETPASAAGDGAAPAVTADPHVATASVDAAARVANAAAAATTAASAPPTASGAEPAATAKPAAATAKPAATTKPAAATTKPAATARPAAATARPAATAAAKPGEHPVLEPPPWWKTLRAEPPTYIRLLLALGFIAALLLLWWYFTHGDQPEDRIVSPSKLPSPKEVFFSYGKVGQQKVHHTFSELLDRDLTGSIAATLLRVVKGMAWAALVGVTLGIVAGSFRAIAAALAPLLIFLRSVPMGALLPLTLVWFTQPEQQKAMFIFIAVVPFVFSDTLKAVSLVPQRYVETAETLGASRRQIIFKVLFPLALPDIMTSLRFQFGLALGYITLAEAVNASSGLGFMINNGQRIGLNEQTYLLLFVIAMIAFAIDYTLRILQRGLFPYRKDL